MVSTLKNARRLEEIIKVFTKHGFGIIFDKVRDKKHISSPEKHLRLILEDLGGAFVKLGQILSLRPDLIPPKYCNELEKLQDNSTPVPYEDIKKIIKEELSRPIKTVFEKINQRPIATGSVAQTHLAKLINGEEVVIKVMKPGVEERFEEDFKLLEYVAVKVKKYVPSFIDVEEIISEFKKYTEEELDFKKELKHISEFQGDEEFKIPKPYPQFNTKRLLIMSYISGKPLSDKNYLYKARSEKEYLSNKITTGIMKQVFIKGIFHGDPHPGNIFVDGRKLGLIDFGIVGKISESTKTKLVMILYSMIERNLDLLIKTVSEIGISKNANKDFEDDLKYYFEKYYDAKLKDINFKDVINTIFYMGNKHNLKLPKELVILGKTIATTESVCEEINPEFNFVQTAKPFLKKNLSKFFNTKMLLDNFKNEVKEYGGLILSLPKDVKRLIQLEERKEKDSLKIQKTLRNLEIDIVFVEVEFILAMFSIIFTLIGIFLLVLNFNPISYIFLNVGIFIFLIILILILKKRKN